MAIGSKKISDLSPDAVIATTDYLVIVSSGVTYKILWSSILASGTGPVILRGSDTAANINAIASPIKGDLWIVTVAGTINSQAAVANDFALYNGSAWEVTGSKRIAGLSSSVAHNLLSFADTGGLVIEDSGILKTNVVQGPASAVSGNLPSFNGTGGKTIQDSGIPANALQSNVSLLSSGNQLVGTTTDGFGIIEATYAGGTSYQFPTPVGQTGRKIITVQSISAQTMTLTTAAGSLVGLPLDLSGNITQKVISAVTWESDGTNWNVISIYQKYGRDHMNQYLGGGSYNSVTITLTGTNSFSPSHSIFIPYQTWDGTWRMQLEISGSISTNSSCTITIPGITFYNGVNQIISGLITSSSFNSAVANSNAATITVTAGSTSTAVLASGDCEIQGKPTWVA